MHPPSKFTLRLLGGFALLRDDRPRELAYEKGRMLMAYLAAEPGRGRPRKGLAALFWPELPDEAALANLRQVLHDLRHALKADSAAPPVLHADRDIVRLDPGAGLEIDVAEFSAPTAACPALRVPSHCRACLGQMEARAVRYRGEFMAECAPPGSGDLDAWLQVQREELHLRALALLNRLADCHERFGDHGKALPYALRFRQLEPWNEAGLRRVMRLLAQNGRRAAALAAYDACRESLNEEFGMPPDTDTQALAERIRRGETLPAARSPAGTLPPAAEERRQVTVLRCEMMPTDTGDPDEALARLREPRAACAEIIQAHGGYLMPAQGGGLLAYFGFPEADEHAARHAVQAALAAMHAACAGIDSRAGIHSGVVIGGGDPQVPDVIGAVTGLATRLSQLAEPGTVAASAATQRLVAGYFDCTNLGARGLHGDARAQEIFCIDRASGARDRLEAAAALTPMVGRRDEIAALRVLWQDARQSARRLVLLRGEAGIGKSRLVLALKEASGERTRTVRELRCFPEHSQSPFHPLAALLGDASTSSSQKPRDQILVDMVDRLYALAAGRPLLLAIEDLHWADPSTLEFLALFVARQRAAPILAVFTARPEFQPPWPQDLVRTLTLNALDDVETAALIAAVAPKIEPATAHRIVERADGVPLFVEEMAKIADQDHLSGIPATLHDLLAARLDRMGEAKRTAQLAAGLGREFELDLLRKVATHDRATLERDLDALQDAGLILKLEGPCHQFKHALIQEAAYQSQTRADRQAAHRRIAQVLQSDFPAVAATQPELLARHLSAGGETRPAIDYWIKAGQRAALISANIEALEHFNAGLSLLTTLPWAQERDRTEFRILVSLCPALYAAKGHGSEDSTQVNARISALSGLVGDSPELFRARWAQAFNTIAKFGYQGAPQAAQQLLQMAHEDPLKKMAAHAMAAAACSWQGEFRSSHAHAVQVVSQHTPDQGPLIWEQFGVDLYTFGMAYSAFSHGFMGFPDQSQQVCGQMIERARGLDNPHVLGQALAFASMACCWSNKPVQGLSLAAETIAISRQHGLFLWLITGEMVHGWAVAMQGRQEGIAEINSGVAGMARAVPGMSVLFQYALAAGLVNLKRHQEALDIIAQVQADAQSKGEYRFNAELQRLAGEALLGLCETNAAQAEAHFHEALAISRKQQAKSLELRAATSLARLWKKQAKRDAARRLLAPVFAWFTEGVDTPDLQDARKLLDSLAR